MLLFLHDLLSPPPFFFSVVVVVMAAIIVGSGCGGRGGGDRGQRTCSTGHQRSPFDDRPFACICTGFLPVVKSTPQVC